MVDQASCSSAFDNIFNTHMWLILYHKAQYTTYIDRICCAKNTSTNTRTKSENDLSV